MSENQAAQADKLIFALDIGTRSVIGLVGWREDDLFRVKYVDSEEYKTRAVIDGQIEDISATAKIAGIVKARLEKKLGTPLHSVHIAAAGRVLHTMQANYSTDLDQGVAIDPRTVSEIEQGAVQRAYEMLFEGEENRDKSYYCVGHAVQKYTLDGYDISSLVDHRGSVAEAHIIATFLPRPVIESLYSTMGHIGLTVAGLTLEPIAAMNAIIPQDLRRLSLALVDIGAGTSDIALCDGGSIAGYTMATIAGDEITEALMNACLVDFATAETIKRAMSSAQEDLITYIDILGITHEATAGDIHEIVRPAIEELGSTLSARILEAAGHAPAAVFLAGGGSRVPGLREVVAQGLKLDVSRVAVGGANNMKRMIVSDEDVFGPEFATPTGIALTAMRQREGDTFVVTVNGEPLHLLSGWDTSALGVLQMSGYRYSDIMSHTGRALEFTVNGERRVIRGGLPTQAVILMDGEPAALSAQVTPGNALVFTPATQGEDAHATLREALGEWKSFPVTIEGEPYQAGTVVLIEGEAADARREIQQGDAIKMHTLGTVGEFCKSIDLDMSEIAVFINDEEADEHTLLCPNDSIRLRGKELRERPHVRKEPQETVQAAPQDEPKPMQQAGDINPLQAPVIPQNPTQTAHQADEQPLMIRIKLNGKDVILPRKQDGTPWQFFDMLALTDIDPQNPQGNIVQKRNDKDVSYLEILQNNDTIDIYWSKVE